MALDRSDYRECLLMNFRKYRKAQPASPLRAAFLYAQAMQAPLPLDAQDHVVERAYREFKIDRSIRENGYSAHDSWIGCYAYARSIASQFL